MRHFLMFQFIYWDKYRVYPLQELNKASWHMWALPRFWKTNILRRTHGNELSFYLNDDNFHQT
jgi:hypothetical protein